MSREWKDGYAFVGPVTIHYLEWGLGPKDLILLHGWTGDAHEWDPIARELSQDFRVVVPDLRGHGDSMKLPQYYTLDDFAKDVYGLVQKLALTQPALVGHSWGGTVGLYTAASYPGILGRVMAEEPVLNSSLRTAAEASLPHILGQKSLTPAEVFAVLRAENPMATECDLDRRWGAIQKFRVAALEQTLTVNKDGDLEGVLSSIGCPVMVLVGKEELGGLIPPGEAERVRQLLPNGTVMVVENMGHTLHYTDPERFLELTRSFMGR